MRELIYRCLDLLQTYTSGSVEFFDWLFTEVDAGILGTISPISLISWGLVISWLVARVILAINK